MTELDSIIYKQVPGLEVHEAEDGLIIFNSHTDRVHHLNPTAGVLFELCQQPTSRAALIDSVQQLYELDAPPDEVVVSAINQLLDERVVALFEGD